ncbi:MAG: helix-turn-helix domain-containing protein [Chloroflexales bacterium]
MRPPSLIPPLDLPDLPPPSRERPAPLQVTINEAARLLAYDARTIRRLIARGELPVVGEGRLRRVPMQSLHEYQERNRC